MFRQLATDARGTRYQPKTLQPDATRFAFDWLLNKLLNFVSRTVSTITPVLVLTFVNADAPTYILLSAIATGFVHWSPSLAIMERLNLASCNFRLKLG